MRIVTILGTSRPGNYTSHALGLVNDELRAHEAEVTTFDPAELVLGFPGVEGDGADAELLTAAVAAADGVVLATPEYHGGYAAMLKLILENLGFPSVLAGKPVALLGVAAGRIGAIKSLEQLRSVCAHVGAIVLPGSVSVAGVRNVFGADGTCNDEKAGAQIRGLATKLTTYVAKHECPDASTERVARG